LTRIKWGRRVLDRVPNLVFSYVALVLLKPVAGNPVESGMHSVSPECPELLSENHRNSRAHGASEIYNLQCTVAAIWGDMEPTFDKIHRSLPVRR
jgi:predicted nucleic acid-binding Zn ribbon protein